MDFSYIDDWLDEPNPQEIADAGEGYRNIWVIGELEGQDLSPGTLEALGQARGLADQIGVYVFGVLLGTDVKAAAQDMLAYGADRGLFVADPLLAKDQPHRLTSALASLVLERRPEIVLLPASSRGNELAPCLAQRLGTGLMSHCTKLELDMAERLLLGTFPSCGGEMLQTDVCPHARPQMATLEPNFFPVPHRDPNPRGTAEQVAVGELETQPEIDWLHRVSDYTLPPTPLPQARIVVAAGRGVRDKKGFGLVQDLARALDGSVAGTRGAFDEGWITEEQIIGVGGMSIAPDLYVACGISGDVHHTYGLQDVGFMVAINNDASAPIMRLANMALLGDAQQILPALLKTLSA